MNGGEGEKVTKPRVFCHLRRQMIEKEGEKKKKSQELKLEKENGE